MEDKSRIDGRWQIFDVEAGRIFTGPDHEEKAEKYLKKKRREYKEKTEEEMKDPTTEKIELNQENIT